MNLFSPFFGKPAPSITAMECSEKLKNGKRPLVIDVRQPDEFRTGHIAGASLVPLGELSRHMNNLPQDREIVCVCASGNRSGSAVRRLVGAGFNAINMRGGMLAWRRAGFPVKKGNMA